MIRIEKARDLLNAGETALAIFTRGEHLVIRPDGTGSTGKWVLDPERKADWLIIYNRSARDGTGGEVWKGRPITYEASDMPRRSIVTFADLARVGDTESNWKSFADANNNPVRYVSAG